MDFDTIHNNCEICKMYREFENSSRNINLNTDTNSNKLDIHRMMGTP